MSPEERNALVRAAAVAEMGPGRFVAMLTASVDRLGRWVKRSLVPSSLSERNVELSQLTRSLRHFAALPSTGNVSTALGYLDMLNGVERSAASRRGVRNLATGRGRADYR